MPTVSTRATADPAAHCDPAQLSPQFLEQLAAQQGIDFATEWLYRAFRASPQHGPAIEAIDRAPRSPSRGSLPDCRVAIVPGAFFRQRRNTGADGRPLLAALDEIGLPSDVIPVESFGSPTDNGAIIRQWLLEYTSPEPLVLVSLSKASADVKLALAERDAPNVFRRVAAWVSLSGLCYGTPLVSWLAARPWRMALVKLQLAWCGCDRRVLDEIDHRHGGPLDFDVRLPESLVAIHVAGFPTTGQLSSRLAARGHRRLAPLGPNDGCALLSDLCRLPGYVYPIRGADHYLRVGREDTATILVRILGYLAERLNTLAQKPQPAAVSR